MDWGLVLFGLKWIFLGLVYLFIGLVLVTVTREMSYRIPQAASASTSVSIGRLRVIQPGSDPGIAQDAVLSLRPNTQIGSKRGNTIILHDRFISGNHARLRWDGISWWVEDLNSTNGTFINHKPVLPGRVELLPYGAVLQMGDMLFEMIE